MGHDWITDCGSLFSHLVSLKTKQVGNECLAIDLSALNTACFGSRSVCDEDVDDFKEDVPLWKGASTMLADCLTKT